MIPRRTWGLFLILAAVSVWLWLRLTYPQMAFIDLSVDRGEAYRISESFLRKAGGRPEAWIHATVFSSDRSADRYLQRALGFRKALDFIRKHDFEFFFWTTRFFRPGKQEEYRVVVSAATGEVVAFKHILDSSAVRPEIGVEEARAEAEAFLRRHFRLDMDRFQVHGDSFVKRQNRIDRSFSWEKKGVFIPWSPLPDTGGAKVLVSASLAGKEVIGFSKFHLEIPNQFQRDLARRMTVGRNLALAFRIVFYALLTAAVFFVIVQRHTLVLQSVKRFGLSLTAFLFLQHIFSYMNNFEWVLYGYPTTSSLNSYVWRHVISLVMDAFIVTLGILMPLLAGEVLHYSLYPQKREGRFLHHILGSWFSRDVCGRVILGYLTACIMFGIQSLAFALGQRYLGVWVEYTWMTPLTGSYWPFLGAFILGVSAAFSEEISFRLFGISLGRKVLRSTVAAVIASSVIWGYGHSTYPVFPMWFRGLEVTCLGLFLAVVYLRFGLLSVITAHFLFDVLWSASPQLLGRASTFDVQTSLAVVLLPLAYGMTAFLLNKDPSERPMRYRLNRHQLFNCAVLEEYLHAHPEILKGPPREVIRMIADHGWDIAVVERAVERVRGGPAEAP